MLQLGAVQNCAVKLKERIVENAALIIKTDAESLDIGEGRIFDKHSLQTKSTVKEIVGAMRRLGRQGGVTTGNFGLDNTASTDEEKLTELSETQYFDSPIATLPNAKGECQAMLSHAYSAHACTVEVDGETGKVEIIDYVIVHDCGNQINPMIVEGQVHGNAAHGISAALYEQFGYSNDGLSTTSSFVDYLATTAKEIPAFKVVSMHTPHTSTPFGIKAVGEGAALPSPACVASAVADALGGFGGTITELPITPEKLLFEIIKKKKIVADSAIA
jgi:CO/xanthine dehydrogenase Mo-binding subunit